MTNKAILKQPFEWCEVCYSLQGWNSFFNSRTCLLEILIKNHCFWVRSLSILENLLSAQRKLSAVVDCRCSIVATWRRRAECSRHCATISSTAPTKATSGKQPLLKLAFHRVKIISTPFHSPCGNCISYKSHDVIDFFFRLFSYSNRLLFFELGSARRKNIRSNSEWLCINFNFYEDLLAAEKF